MLQLVTHRSVRGLSVYSLLLSSPSPFSLSLSLSLAALSIAVRGGSGKQRPALEEGGKRIQQWWTGWCWWLWEETPSLLPLSRACSSHLPPSSVFLPPARCSLTRAQHTDTHTHTGREGKGGRKSIVLYCASYPPLLPLSLPSRSLARPYFAPPLPRSFS